MDDPDFSVSLVKLDSTCQEECKESEMPNYSSWISSTKGCHLLWDSLRKQGQLFKVLDTLTTKTARLIGKVQNQTASDEDSATVVELLSQLGIMFIDEETKQDGNKEKRYTFVTDVESTMPQKQTVIHATTTQPEQVTLVSANATEADREVDDDDPVDGFDTIDAEEDPADVQESPTGKVCEWCKKDQGTVVLLDLHKVQSCEVLMKYRPHHQSMPCPNCGSNYRQLARLQHHLLVDHEMETVKVMKFLHEVKHFRPEQQEEDKDPKSQEEEEEEEEEEDQSSDSETNATEMAPKTHMVCEVCQDKYGTRIELRTHLMEAHDFSRQKAVSSVYESVKSAQSQAAIKRDSHVPKKAKKDHGYSFQCMICESSHGDRRELVDHIMSVHGLPQGRAQKEANKQYKDMNSTFACDLCPSKYISRFVFSKHLIRVHKLSKKQAQTKSIGMYPLDRKRHGSKKSNTKNSKLRDEDKDVEEHSSEQPQRYLRSTGTRRSECKIPERTSRRLAQRRKEEVSNDDGEDKQGNHDNDEANITDEEDNQDKESNISDSDLEDEDYIPSEPREQGNPSRKKHSEKTPKKQIGQISDPKLDVGISDTDREKEGEENAVADGEVKKSRRKNFEKPKKKRGPKSGQTSVLEGGHNCPHCDKTFRNLNYFKVHISAFHKENPAYQCSTCQKTFYIKNIFIRHLNCHKNEEMGIRYTCDVCGKCFFDKYTLGTHSKIHSGDKPFKCDFCDRCFFHQSLLRRHRNMHTRETEYKCSYCNRVFYRKGGLKYHILSLHEKKRDHICSNCGQGFASKSILLAHLHTHSTHRAFQCDQCGTRVKTKGNLKEHMMCVHTDKRAFKCEICQKTFNRSHRLTLHMMMHRDERPHKCHLCDKAFRTRTNLTVHIKWHQDQRDFQCEQCGKTFLIPGNLERHMQTHKNGKSAKRKNAKKAPAQETKLELQNPDQTQLPVHVESEVCPTVETQFQTVQNLVAGGGFESDLPTLASIAQHLSTMNIPVFQVPNTSTQGPTSIPVTINPGENTCTPLPGSVISGDAATALAVFTHTQQQLQVQSSGTHVMPVVTQSMQGNFEQIELTM